MRFPFMLMFTTRLVVVARKLKRRVHAFIESIDTCHRDFIEFAYSNSTSGAKVFDVFENWVTSAWCVFRAFGFSFRQLFSPFRSPFFFLLFFISCTNRSNSSLFSKRNFLPFVHSVGHAALRAHQIITRNVLSHCHGIIIATYVAFLSRKDFAI